MSKKRRRRQRAIQHVQNAKARTHRFIVPLAEWKRFEGLSRAMPMIEEAIADLQESWLDQVTMLCDECQCSEESFEDFSDAVIRISDLIRGLDFPKNKRIYQQPAYQEYVSHRPNKKNKFENMVAEIIIEDVTDGDKL